MTLELLQKMANAISQAEFYRTDFVPIRINPSTEGYVFLDQPGRYNSKLHTIDVRPGFEKVGFDGMTKFFKSMLRIAYEQDRPD